MPDGYIRRHIRSFTFEDRPILIPMTITGDYILEHRAVMALHLGRPLKDTEVVHHLNGKKDDNRIENLVVCPTNGHNDVHTEILQRLHQLMKRVKELEIENKELRIQISR